MVRSVGSVVSFSIDNTQKGGSQNSKSNSSMRYSTCSHLHSTGLSTGLCATRCTVSLRVYRRNGTGTEPRTGPGEKWGVPTPCYAHRHRSAP